MWLTSGYKLMKPPGGRHRMEIASVCLMISTLSLTPNRSQFFSYNDIFLRCVTPANCPGWTVWRNTTLNTNQKCQRGWGIPGNSSCTIEYADQSDTGVYWCESEQGERSNTVNISVTDGPVILESPALPVMEGDEVTLRCSYKEKHHQQSASNFSAEFYRDGAFIGTKDAGKMVLPAVSTSDEGFYMCEHPSRGQSPQSWLAVRARAQSTSGPPILPTPVVYQILVVCSFLLLYLSTVLLVVTLCIYRRLTRAQADAKRGVFHHLLED